MNYSKYSIGAKVASYDKDGYYIMPLCGTIEQHVGENDAIIKSSDGMFYSTVGYAGKVAEILETPMPEIRFSMRSSMRTYGIELRERNYPTFEGKYNAYVACYGMLSGSYLGAIDAEPVAMDIEPSQAPELVEKAAEIVSKGYTPVIW